MLALDVWRLYGAKRPDLERFIQTGQLDEPVRGSSLPRTEMAVDAYHAASEAKRDGKPWDIIGWVQSRSEN